MLKTCLEASQLNLSIFLLGGTEQVLMQLHKNLQSMFPNLNIGTYSPPFGDFSETENRKISNLINNSSANLVWLHLEIQNRKFGCHKIQKTLIVFLRCRSSKY